MDPAVIERFHAVVPPRERAAFAERALATALDASSQPKPQAAALPPSLARGTANGRGPVKLSADVRAKFREILERPDR